MDGQRNFNRIDRNRGSGIYRCSDYGKKEIRKSVFCDTIKPKKWGFISK